MKLCKLAQVFIAGKYFLHDPLHPKKISEGCAPRLLRSGALVIVDVTVTVTVTVNVTVTKNYTLLYIIWGHIPVKFQNDWLNSFPQTVPRLNVAMIED